MQRIDVPDKSPESSVTEYVGYVRENVETWIKNTVEALMDDISQRKDPLQAKKAILRLHGYRVAHPVEVEADGLTRTDLFTPMNVLKSYRAHFYTEDEAWEFCWDDYKERSPKND